MKPNLIFNDKTKLIEINNKDYYLTIITGLPGSGKTTYSKYLKSNNPNLIIIEMDKINEIIFSNKYYYEIENELKNYIGSILNTLDKEQQNLIKNYLFNDYMIYKSTSSFIRNIYKLCKEFKEFRKKFILEGECFMFLVYHDFILDFMIQNIKWVITTHPIIKSWFRKIIRELKGIHFLEIFIAPFFVIYNIPNDYKFYRKEILYYEYLLNRLKSLEIELPYEYNHK